MKIRIDLVSLVSLTSLSVALAAFAAPTFAQNPSTGSGQPFPTRAVRIVVGFAPGGATDVTARILAQELGRAWNQQVVVDNRPGASGAIAGELVARAAPDGYTLLVSPQTTTVVAPILIKKLNFDPQKDFAAAGVVGSTPQLLVVLPTLPARTFKEFMAFARANASKLSYGSGGIGSTPHMAGELLNLSLGVKITHVPYKGEVPALTDVLGGQLPYMFANIPVALPQARAGKLRSLAITSLQRSQIAPEYPTVAESGIPGFDTATWSGLYMPSATPRDLVARISADAAKGLSQPETKKRMLEQGIDYGASTTPEGHAAYLKTEFARWSKVIEQTGAKSE